MKNSKNVVLGVCGGIAAYKSLDLVSKLVKNNIDVDVVMTKNACEFINPLSFQSISKNPVTYSMFKEPTSWDIKHISLAKKADVVAIVPATANIIGKIASGIADDILTTTVMATQAQVMIAPAMNTNMYKNIIVQDNIKKLKKYNYKFIEPQSGRLACGDIGIGKLASVEYIYDAITSELCKNKDLIGKKVLVTAGPTIAPIDPVRFITNKSTGKMGYAIAKIARNRGADVTLISGPCNLERPYGIKLINVKTNNEMYNAVIDEYDHSDIVIKAAAVSDFKVSNYSKEKIKKNNDKLALDMVKDTDILMELGKRKSKQILVGFAAESSNIIQNALNKLKKKNLDYIVANCITEEGIGFASNENKVTILSKSGEIVSLEKMSKEDVAEELFNLIIEKR